MKLIKALQNFEMDETEAKIYLALLSLLDAPVSLVARKAGVKRTTAYNALEDLRKKGLASSYREKGVLRFVAENPKNLEKIWQEKMSILEEILPKLIKLQESTRTRPKVSYFEGKKGVKILVQMYLEDNKEKILRTLGSYSELKKIIGRRLKLTQKRIQKGIRHFALRAKNEIKDFRKDFLQNQLKELREVRFLPENLEISGFLLIWDNYTGFISGKEEYYGILIESDHFANLMKQIFEFLWQISEKTG